MIKEVIKVSGFRIAQKWITMFNNQITWREKVHGHPLQPIQKVKAARAVSHERFPTDMGFGGYKGHVLRERFRKEILKSVGVDYRKQNRRWCNK